MENKIYSSFEQIDAELEILKIEKEINYQKMILGFQRTKEEFTLTGLAKNVFSMFKSFVSNITVSDNTVLKLVFPFIIKWIFNKKRSH